MSHLSKFISENMKDYTHIQCDNIKKIFNKDFDILVNNQLKKPQVLIIDKRNNTFYNNVEIALGQIQK
jgi:hypothetical protein